jgi:hypothetical protein
LPSISEGIILKNLPTPEPSPKIFITLIFNFFLNILSKKKKKTVLTQTGTVGIMKKIYVSFSKSIALKSKIINMVKSTCEPSNTI